ncbi:hypothetical protein Tco_0603447 [Tanacetum coccineum]
MPTRHTCTANVETTTSKSGPNWKFEVEEVSMKANGNSASNGCDEGDKFNAPRTKPILFSSLLNPECSSKKMNFRTLLSAVRMEHYDVVLPKASIDNIKSRFQKLMWNNDGVFLLTFASKSGVMEIPVEDGTGYTKEIIRVEYEWKPPHCIDCKLFGHAHNLCPKRVKKVDTSAPNTDSPKDGFTKVTNRNNKVKKTDYNQPKTRPIGGIRLTKPKLNFHRPDNSGSKQGGDAV